jgi:hypothetical protein
MHHVGLNVFNGLTDGFVTGFDDGGFGDFIAALFHQRIPVGQCDNRSPVNGAALIAKAIHPVPPVDEIAKPALHVDIGSICNVAESQGVWHGDLKQFAFKGL